MVRAHCYAELSVSSPAAKHSYIWMQHYILLILL